MRIKNLLQNLICIYCIKLINLIAIQCLANDYSINDNLGYEFNFDGIRPSQVSQQTYSSSNLNCCEDVMIIDSLVHPEGYLKAPPAYDELNDPKNSKKTIECVYKFYGRQGERIQLFYEDFDLYYPINIYKFNKIEYADSICLKFYETMNVNQDEFSKQQQQQQQQLNLKPESFSLENHNYDLCNCINVSYTPRQIMSAGNFIQVRFKTIPRSFDSILSSTHSKQPYRGYLLRYKFIKDYGIDFKEGGEIDKEGNCKVYFYSTVRKDGYFASPNYPGLYPRDIECHYYFIGEKDQKVQITFHTFDVEGVEQCKAETKSDYVELSNFQNRDRAFKRFCGYNKPASIMSDASFFHVSFYSNNVFDAKGFQASYYFVNTGSDTKQKKKAEAPNSASAIVSDPNAENKSNQIRTFYLLIIVNNLIVYLTIY